MNSICTIKDLDKLKGNDPLVIYGAGKAAERTCEMLEAMQIPMACFCISGETQGEELLGKKLICYLKLNQCYQEYQILIATSLVNTFEIQKMLEYNEEKNIVYFFEELGAFLHLYAVSKYSKKEMSVHEFDSIPYDRLIDHIQYLETETNQILIDVKNNAQDYKKIYRLMEDDLSKQVLKNLLLAALYQSNIPLMEAFRLTVYPDEVSLRNTQYFCDDIFRMGDDEVFVQCGGFDGGTVITYITKYKRYKKVYVYEPTPGQFELTRKNLRDFPDVIVKQKGVFDRQDQLKFVATSDVNNKILLGANRIREDGNIEIETVRLDDDIREPVTLITMDIEGAEIPALMGAREHITKEHPKLAVCVYHTPDALRKACLLIHEFSPRYHFYLRHHTINNSETVLYAV